MLRCEKETSTDVKNSTTLFNLETGTNHLREYIIGLWIQVIAHTVYFLKFSKFAKVYTGLLVYHSMNFLVMMSSNGFDTTQFVTGNNAF